MNPKKIEPSCIQRSSSERSRAGTCFKCHDEPVKPSTPELRTPSANLEPVSSQVSVTHSFALSVICGVSRTLKRSLSHRKLAWFKGTAASRGVRRTCAAWTITTFSHKLETSDSCWEKNNCKRTRAIPVDIAQGVSDVVAIGEKLRDATDVTRSQLQAISAIERVCSVLSLVACVLTMATYCASKSFRKPINRLVFYASFGNMLSNVGALMSQAYTDRPNSPQCQFQAFLIQL